MENITKEKLERIYYDNPNKKAMEILGVCQDTLVTMIKEAGIKPKGKAYKKKYNIIVGE